MYSDIEYHRNLFITLINDQNIFFSAKFLRAVADMIMWIPQSNFLQFFTQLMKWRVPKDGRPKYGRGLHTDKPLYETLCYSTLLAVDMKNFRPDQSVQ